MSQLVLNPARLDDLAEDHDPVALASMLSTFCDSVESLRRAADEAWSARDDDALRGALRDLAATSAMFGAEDLSRSSRDLAGRIDADEVPLTVHSLHLLDEQCGATRDAVRRYVAAKAYDDVPSRRAAAL